jgi:hypothetical protein
VAPFCVAIGSSLVVGAGVEELTDCAQELKRGGWWRDAAGEDGLEGEVLAVVVAGVIGVLVNYVAGEVDACEEALAAGVGEDGRVGEFGGGGLRVASDGTGCYGEVAAELNLVLEEALEGVVGSGEEDEVGGLSARLEAEAGSGELDEGGCAPAMAGAAGDDSLTILRADDEGSFFEGGNDGDACGTGGDVVGDALVGCCHEFVENEMGCFNPFIELLHVGGGRCGEGDGCGDACYLNYFFYHRNYSPQ